MPEFDPIKIFQRLWAVNFGKSWVILTILLTGANVILHNTIMLIATVSAWVILILYYLGNASLSNPVKSINPAGTFEKLTVGLA